jgi:hypothetical protein
MNNSANIVANKIYSAIYPVMEMPEFIGKETDSVLLQELFAQLEKAMTGVLEVSDCWHMAVTCAGMWNTGEFNRNLFSHIVAYACTEAH